VAPHLAKASGDTIPEMRDMMVVLWREVELNLTEIAMESESRLYAKRLLDLERTFDGMSLILVKGSSKIDESSIQLVFLFHRFD
jgi:hypothetical protein